MNVGSFFFLAAVVLFFFAAIGVGIIPQPTAWGLCCLALGHLLGGVGFPAFTRTVVVAK